MSILSTLGLAVGLVSHILNGTNWSKVAGTMAALGDKVLVLTAKENPGVAGRPIVGASALRMPELGLVTK